MEPGGAPQPRPSLLPDPEIRLDTRPAPPRRALTAALALVALAGCDGPSRSAGWECIAPAAPGGGWDLTCRSVARVLESASLAPASVRTTNMPGAGGGVAFAHVVARRRADPSVLVAASPATTLRLAQGQYGPLAPEDVRWIGAVGAEYGIVAVDTDAPWPDLRALLSDWRARPEGIVASGGSTVLGQDHVKVLLLARAAGIDPHDVRYVPFDGGGEALTSLLGGFVQVFSGEASEIEGQLAAGAVRVLAVLAPERLPPPLDAVPTAREQGFDVEWTTWRGFYVPADLPDTTVARWVDVVDRLGSSPEWAEARRRNRLRPFLLTGDAFASFVDEQVEQFRALSRDLGLIR